MASTIYTHGTKVLSTWLNDINGFFYTLFAGATTAADARTAIGAAPTASPTFTGTVTVNGVAATPFQGLLLQGSTTSSNRLDITNTGGSLRIGTESSVGSTLVGGSTAYAGCVFTTNSTPLQLGSNNTIYASLSSTSFAPIGLLDLSTSTAGQIKFPATQNPSSNANTLDDYEEGTWTPTLDFGFAAVGLTYSSQVGTYTKIGNRCIVSGYFGLTAVGSSTGAAHVGGLPFASSTSAGTYTTLTCRGGAMFGMSGHMQAYTVPNQIFVTLEQIGTGASAALVQTNFTASTDYMVAGAYLV